MSKNSIVKADNGTSVVKVTPEEVSENLRLIEDLKFFLATAPANWQENQIIRRYYLNHDEGFVSCVFWNNLYFVTGTDIVRAIVYKLELFGREILDRKKFEEGIFSDLRSLKCGNDSVLEDSKSSFLKFLYKNSCLRTQKKQKVFFWFSVPHDKLFADALERDLRKEVQDQEGTTKAISEPALSFKYNQNRNIHDQLSEYIEKHRQSTLDDMVANSDRAITPVTNDATLDYSSQTDVTEQPAGPNLNLQIEGQKPQTYLIKEEDGQKVVTPGELDDDFPLDYFPPNYDPGLIDPSVFFNQPDTFDDRFLIDQTYLKTPYQVAFDKKLKGKETEADEGNVDDTNENEQGMSSLGYYPQYAGHLVGPPMPSSYPMYPPPQQQTQPQITNAQYYDSQMNGKQIELQRYQSEYSLPSHPYYSGFAAPPPQPSSSSAYHLHFLAQAQAQAQAAAYSTAVGAGYYYDQPYYQEVVTPSAFFPHFINDMKNDGDDQLYDAFETRQRTTQIISPFGRFFPSFEATAPPTATKSRFPRSATQSRFSQSNNLPGLSIRIQKPPIGKKKGLRKPNTASILGKSNEKGTLRIVEPNEELEENELKDNEESKESEEVKENVNAPEDAEGEEEEGYNSLPTPDSTAGQATKGTRKDISLVAKSAEVKK